MAGVSPADVRAVVSKCLGQVQAQLYDSVVPFWLRHSLDRVNGGYFNCLDRDGTPFDTKKHIWLQGRQVWMLSKLYNESERLKGDPALLDAARLGVDFLRKHASRDDGRVYFSVTAEGQPHFMQRKMFAECFFLMALAEYGRASGDASCKAEALAVFEQVLHYVDHPGVLGRPQLAGQRPTSELAVPMILLNVIDELRTAFADQSLYSERAEWCVNRIRQHVVDAKGWVLENVSAVDGTPMLDSPEGRLINPGHAIEAGWFLLAYAIKSQRKDLYDLAAKMVDDSFEIGWDKQYGGGILYFVDCLGHSPVQLEWSMKLWWPHNEAMVAYALLFKHFRDDKYLRRFVQVLEYSLSHFADAEHGEWFGYLDRRGVVTHNFKGGPYKGFFHVPRSLFLCEKILSEILSSL